MYICIHMCVYIYIYICICIHTYIHIYIYIERERETVFPWQAWMLCAWMLGSGVQISLANTHIVIIIIIIIIISSSSMIITNHWLGLDRDADLDVVRMTSGKSASVEI